MDCLVGNAKTLLTKYHTSRLFGRAKTHNSVTRVDCLVEKVTDPFNNVSHEYFGRAKTLVTKYHMRRLFCRAKNLLTKYHMSTDCLAELRPF